MNIKEFMTKDHKDCDQFFATAENAASQGNWDTTYQAFNAFIQVMERHFGVEEEALFPAFEEATGILAGPTEMMRMEHQQMRNLFTEMREAVEQQDTEDYLGAAETLLIMMQQHNMKEEQILYTIMSQQLPENANHWQQKFNDWDKN